MRAFFRNTLIVSGLLLGIGAPAHADKTFNIGSLIIPPGAAYQTECGAVAVYGLVYNVLRANAWLEANKATVCPTHTAAQTCKIEIYYNVKATKLSPNRCTPLSNTLGTADKAHATATSSNDPQWNDGCDFAIVNTVATPVRLVDTFAPFGVDTSIVTVDNIGESTVFPQFPSRTVTFPTYTTVRYGGGPFVIDEIDAPVFLALLKGTLAAPGNAGRANDSAAGTGNWVDFAPFRANPTSCAFPATVGGYVAIHRSATVFTAPALKAFSTAPPRVALLATTQGATTINQLSISQKDLESTGNTGAIRNAAGVITFKTKNNHGFVIGDWILATSVGNAAYNTPVGTIYTIATIPTSKTFTVAAAPGALAVSGGGRVSRVGIWKNTGTGVVSVRTSANHGMLAGQTALVGGTSVSAYNGSYVIGSVVGPRELTLTGTVGAALAASGDGDISSTGVTITKKVSDGILQKYLALAGLAFPGAGGCPPGGINVGNLAKCPGGGVRGQIYDTFDISDIVPLLDPTFYKMIWTPHWETKSSAFSAPTAGEIAAIARISTFLDGQAGLMAECHSIEAFEGTTAENAATVGQFQTCTPSGTSTPANPVCAGTTVPYAILKNAAGPTGTQFNCSDPTTATGSSCIYFGYPGDPFAQPGDFKFVQQGGSVTSYKPRTAAPATIYEPGVLPLIAGVNSLDKTKLVDPVTARQMVNTDFASRSQKDNDTTKGNILYMGGHDVSGVVSSSKIILQSLLLLGEPPIVTTIEEVSRASPIVVGLAGVTAIVQGSFEQLTPAGSTTTADSDAEVATFRFPDVKGHMRAVDVTTLTAQTAIKDLVEVFDAADRLPATTNSYTGCGGNAFGAGTGNCRTIFTHTDSGMGPDRVLFESSEAANATLKAAINLGGATLNLQFGEFLKKIIAGGAGSIAVLGGVDRSTVAVVPSSAVVPGAGARPTIIYFGGTDGMLHAVCGSVSPGPSAPCDVLGRELWAFVPKRQLPYLRKNTARVDGSVRVLDLFADLDGAKPGTRGFKTLLVFQTTNGDPAVAGKEPSITGLDVSDPTDPKIAFDFALPGQGLIVNVGRVTVNGVNKYLAFAQTNAGAAAVGNVVTAVDVETGLAVWKSGGPVVGSPYLFTPGTLPSRLAGTTPPVTGIPGGAVGVDTRGTGNVSDVVFGTLYGDVWQLDAATGANRHGASPLFQFSTDQHPIGSPIAIFGDGSLYGLAAPGGYADLAASTLWSAGSHTAVALKLYPALPTGTSLPLLETSTPPGLKFTFAMAAGDKVFSQPVISGGSAYITAESLDANALAYGSVTANTGRVYRVPLAPACVDAAPADGECDNAPAQTAAGVLSSVVAGGVSSVWVYAGGVYVMGKNAAQKLGTSDTSAGGSGGSSMDSTGTTVAVSSSDTPRVTRKLWLRTL